MEYDFPFDYLETTPERALQLLEDFDVLEIAKKEGWVLCREYILPVRCLSQEGS